MKVFVVFTIVAAIILSATLVQAEVVIDTVSVGNPGNPGDLDHEDYGSVGYTYDIATYEVTAGQYAQFLNAVAATDTYGLYNRFMWDDEYHADIGCKIQRAGSPGTYTYSVAPDRADRPVNYVSWGSAARFCNWLRNGQPTGEQDLTTTEDGSYFLDGVMDPAELAAVDRENDASWVIPSEDEWYKAAYHKNDGATGNYWYYPTGSDDMPSNNLVDPDPGNNATFWDNVVNDYTVGHPYYRTEVGAHENSASPYGTFDQGGNVMEWNESKNGLQRGIRGGSYWISGGNLRASDHSYSLGNREDGGLGFRVALVPEPVTLALLALGGLLTLRRSRTSH